MVGRDRSRIAVLAVAGLALLVGLLYLAHSAAPRSPAADSEASRRGPAGRNGMFAPDRPSVAAPPVADDQAGVVAPPAPDQVPLAELLDDARARVLAAAGGCAMVPAHPAERVTLRYRLAVKRGEASLAQLTTLDSTLSDENLHDCLVGRALALTWPVRAADGEAPIDQVVELGQLFAARGLPVPDPEDYPAPQPPEAPLPKRPADVPDWK